MKSQNCFGNVSYISVPSWYPASRGPSIFLDKSGRGRDFPTYLGRSKGLCSQGKRSWRPGVKEVTALKDAAENLNTRKGTVNWVRVFENWCDENGLGKSPDTVRPEQLDKVLERFFACVCKQDGTDHDSERNLSPMILKGNQKWYTRESRK